MSPDLRANCKGSSWHGSAFADRFGAAEGFRCCPLEAAFLQAIFQYRKNERSNKIRQVLPARKYFSAEVGG